MIYDAALGWRLNPADFPQGIRADATITPQPAPDTLRIALFGDSFTYADEVPLEDAWSTSLQAALNDAGYRVEVLNFGVPAYGMDQAYLAWQLAHTEFAPDLVLFGFQPENIARNVNVFRTLYNRESIFTKPRYIFEGDGLTLVNQPPMPPAELADWLPRLDDHPLIVHEWHHQPARWWHASRLLSLLAQIADNQQSVYANLPPDDERAAITAAILDAYGADVTASGAAFAVVHLPDRFALNAVLSGSTPGYLALLDPVAEMYPVIDGLAVFEGDQQADWAPDVHYSATTNARLGQYIAAELIACWDAGNCLPDRFTAPADFARD